MIPSSAPTWIAGLRNQMSSRQGTLDFSCRLLKTQRTPRDGTRLARISGDFQTSCRWVFLELPTFPILHYAVRLPEVMTFVYELIGSSGVKFE